MSYNGSGTFDINSTGQPVVTGTAISSTVFNAFTADIGTGLSTALTKDGQTVATARIPFAAGINSSLVTDATNTTTGSIITAGGVGVAKALFVGTTANIAGTTTLAGVTATSITDSGLTSGRVTFASTAGLLADAAALAWDGTSLSATKFSGALNGTVGATTPAAGAFTTGTFSSTLAVTGITTVAAGTELLPAIVSTTGTADTGLWFPAADTIAASTAGTERMRIDSSGNVLVGTPTASGLLTVRTGNATVGTQMVAFSDSNGRFSGFYQGADGVTFNAANTVFAVRQASGTGRSINASGTVNASGADYAEYMTKAGDFTVAKGDVVGIDANGQLTNIFDKALSFVVKSTNPSYVGGDVWGTEEALELEKPSDDAPDEEKIAFDAALEAARQKVDRIAFAGQVPVNVTGATAGQYIIPVNNNGAIKGQAVSNPTFEQYQIAVGKVIAIESDGRAKIIVKMA